MVFVQNMDWQQKKIGTMPDWDVSRVKDMGGGINKNFYNKGTFNGDISR